MERASGILMPVFSLPSKYGMGGFGEESYNFIDFLAESKVKVWQILPLVQTGYGNSPYSSISAESFNPLYIDLVDLKERGLITDRELNKAKLNTKLVDYGWVFWLRYPILRKAFSRFDRNDKAFKKFVKDKEYYDYALYMAIKEKREQKPFYEWESELASRCEDAIKKFDKENKEEILFWQFLQFMAKTQWLKLKDYANKKGVKILGDMPLYVALDSVDVWKNPQLFKLDDNYRPTKVAGVPPDYFSKTGQLWGNPVYDYDKHKEDNFGWWSQRLQNTLKIFDLVRIDHFRGLDRYFEINAGEATAENGVWVDVPSEELFDNIHKTVDGNRIIAEDLGIIDDGVRELLAYTGYPGMKILSFAFNGEPNNLYLPQNIEENAVCYTGTHDNDTLYNLIDTASEWDYNNLVNGVKNSLKLLKIRDTVVSKKSLAKRIIVLGYASKADLFIIPFADVMLKGGDYRINCPGTVSNQNWSIRFGKRAFSKGRIKYLSKLAERYGR